MDLIAYISIVLFLVALAVNSLAVYFQKKNLIYDKYFSDGHKAHCTILGTVWTPFLFSVVWLGFSGPSLSKYPLIGWPIFLVATVLFCLSYRQIGIDGVTNKDIFTNERKELGGVYRYVPGPMYLSYTLLFFGWGVISGVTGFYLLSIVSVLGLQIIEAKIESLPNNK